MSDSCRCYISTNDKYYIYHTVVCMQFILTLMYLSIIQYNNITGFVLSCIIIQIILFCCINVDNRQNDMPTCCVCIIGYSNFAHIFVLIPYMYIHIHDFKEVQKGSLYGIYLVGLFIYVFIVLVMINTYYLSGAKFSEIYCVCYKPRGPELPQIHLPKINITQAVREIKIYPGKSCLICYEKNHPIKTLTCGHKLCLACVNDIGQHAHDNIGVCPFCRASIEYLNK